MKHSLDELLRTWGAAQRALPADHAAMRSRVLASVQPRVAPRTNRTPTVRWPALAFAVLALLAFLAHPEQYFRTRIVATAPATTSGDVAPSLRVDQSTDRILGYEQRDALRQEQALRSDFSAPSKSIAPWYPPEPRSEPITDRRELLEWSYAATIRTGRIAEIGARVQTVVRGHGGRIDRLTVNDRYGNIGFALPVDQFDAFRTELATLARARFLFTENVSAENRLTEQVDIESSLRTTSDSLAEQTRERTATADRYRGVIAAQQRAVAKKSAERNAARAELDALPPDAPERTALTTQLRTIDRDLSMLQRELRRVAAERDQRLTALDATIRNTTNAIAQLHARETALRDTVATVTGSVSLVPIPYGSLVGAFARNHWIALVLITLAILAFVRLRPRPLVLPTP